MASPTKYISKLIELDLGIHLVEDCDSLHIPIFN